jgi:hypothetical protein
VFTIGLSQHAPDGSKKVQGYLLVQGILQWPHLNTNAETFADVLLDKAMALLDTFPIGVLLLYPFLPNCHTPALGYYYLGSTYVSSQPIYINKPKMTLFRPDDFSPKVPT